MARKEDVYCTLVMNDAYLPGAAVLAHSLRDAGTTKKLACLVLHDRLRESSLTELRSLFNYVIPIDPIGNPRPANLYLMNRPDLLYTFTKIHLWNQTQFRKIVYIDADVVALRAPEELFDIQESFAAAPDVGWPDAFNTGVMVISPCQGHYHALRTLATAGDSFDGADQGLLNQYFEHQPWKRISFTYNATPSANYQYEPAYRYFKRDISLVHFIGAEKPWQRGRSASGTPSAFQEMLSRWWAVYDRHFRVSAADYIHGRRNPVTYYAKADKSEPPNYAAETLSATGYPVATTGPAPPPQLLPPHEMVFYPPHQLSHHHRQSHEQHSGQQYQQHYHQGYEQSNEQHRKQDYGPYQEQHQEHYQQQHHEQPHQQFHQQSHEQQPHEQQSHEQQPHEQQSHEQQPHERSHDPYREHSYEVQHAHSTASPLTPELKKSVEIAQQSQHAPDPTTDQPAFSAPHMEWDATRGAPPLGCRPEAANFPTQVYEFNHDPEPFRPPPSYPEPPKDVWYSVPEKAISETEIKPIFPWEGRKGSRPTRRFIEDELVPSPPPLMAESEPFADELEVFSDRKQEPTTPTIRISDEPWATFANNKNAWDNVAGIENYVRALNSFQRKRGKAEAEVSPPNEMIASVLSKQAGVTGVQQHILSPTKEPCSEDIVETGRRRRESLILTDFPSAVERPSLPVTPAPRRRPTFWDGGRDETSGLPEAEGVPDQVDWDPSAQLEQLRRNSLIGPGDLKLPEKLLSRRRMPSTAVEIPEESLVHSHVLFAGSDGAGSASCGENRPDSLGGTNQDDVSSKSKDRLKVDTMGLFTAEQSRETSINTSINSLSASATSADVHLYSDPRPVTDIVQASVEGAEMDTKQTTSNAVTWFGSAETNPDVGTDLGPRESYQEFTPL